MMRFLNASIIDAVNAVSPWLGLQIMPLPISGLRALAEVAHPLQPGQAQQ